MEKDKEYSVYRDALKVSICVFILGIIELIGFFLFKSLKSDVFLGALLGCLFASANFFYLAYCVKKTTQKSENAAKAYMSGTYTIRIFFTAVIIFVAAKVDFINVWATIIPIVFPRISIFILNIFKKRGEEK